MPRKARIDHPGLVHHIMARTFNDLKLFNDDADRNYYLSCLSSRIKETGFICYAWVLMDTHVHLLIRTTELPLWKLMKPLNGDYAHYYNKKFSRRGPLFSDRYKSIATQDQFYLEQLVRYIHLNPVRAGICKTIAQLDRYPWCGHRILMGDAKNGFQETREVLRRFGKSASAARRNYRNFLNSGLGSDEHDDLISLVRDNNSGKRDRNYAGYWVIGDAAFQKSVYDKALTNRITVARYKRDGITLDDLAKAISKKMEIDDVLIRFPSKKTPYADARKIFCLLASTAGFPSLEIGYFLGIQQAAVSHAARKGVPLAAQKGITLDGVIV